VTADITGTGPNGLWSDRTRQRMEEIAAHIRDAVRALPEVGESVDGFGHIVFKVGKKSFVLVGAGREGQGSLFIKSDPVSQQMLIARGPYIRAPYIGQHGWVCVWGDVEVDWREVRELVRDAYRLVAPRKLLRKLGED